MFGVRIGLMILIIRSHNRLNGPRFSSAEYAVIALILAVLAAYYLIHREWLLAFIAWGITCNCLPGVALGISELRTLAREDALQARFGTNPRARDLGKRIPICCGIRLRSRRLHSSPGRCWR